MPRDVTAQELRDPDPFLGRVVGDAFRIEERIGSGAMGHVYRAARVDGGGRAAVKVLRPELAGDISVLKRFRREARAAQAVDSPHVVRIFDYGDAGGDAMYIAMELLDGESLADRLDREHRLPAREAVHVAQGVGSALVAAHEAGVIHRDLKPANVMLGSDGVVKVVDFGIARLLEGSAVASDVTSKLTVAGTILGTPMYMSPEAAGRKPVGPAADLYALGVMLFEMIAGEPPFDDEDPILIIGMHLRAPPPLLREAAPDAPEALEALIVSLMRKDPEKRPDAKELLARLGVIDLELSVQAEAARPVVPDTLRDATLDTLLAETKPLQPSPPEWVEETERMPPLEEAAPAAPAEEVAKPARPKRLWIAVAALVLVPVGVTVVVLGLQSGRDEVRAEEPAARTAPRPEQAPAAASPAPAAPREQPGTGALTVRSDVRCTLEVDGEVVGPTPVVGHDLPAGVHRLRCVAPGRGAGQARVEVRAGDTVDHLFRFARRRGRGGMGRDLDIAREYR